jgi:hypothetical protein
MNQETLRLIIKYSALLSCLPVIFLSYYFTGELGWSLWIWLFAMIPTILFIRHKWLRDDEVYEQAKD